MAVPTYDQFIEPILRCLAANPQGMAAREVHDAAANALGVSEADKAELLPSGVQLVYKNRAGWAHDRLKRAGLSTSRRRGYWQLTEAGVRFAQEQPSPLPVPVLEALLTEYNEVRLRPSIVAPNIEGTADQVSVPEGRRSVLMTDSNMPWRSYERA